MPPQGEVARQWFIPGEGIDRSVITADIQRYLGNDATVRPGVGTENYQGVQGYWIKAYRNFTSAMIADLRADSQRWRQEQRQNGAGEVYVGSRTYDESNAGRVQRDGNSPSLDAYGAPVPPRQRDGRQVDNRRPTGDAMQIDAPPGRAPQTPAYGQPGYYPPGGQYPPDANRYAAAQGRAGQGYPQDQPMADVYGQPDNYGRYPVNYSGQPDRANASYPQQAQAPPPGYAREGNYYVPISSGYGQQPGVMATTGPDQGYYAGQQPSQQPRNPGQPTSRPPQRDPQYDSSSYNPYPSPAQTVAGPQEGFVNPTRGSGYPAAQGQYNQYAERPVSNPAYPYPQESGYAPPQNTQTRQQPSSGHSDRSGRRNR